MDPHERQNIIGRNKTVCSTGGEKETESEGRSEEEQTREGVTTGSEQQLVVDGEREKEGKAKKRSSPDSDNGHG